MDENEQKALDAAMDFISFAHKRGYPFSGNVSAHLVTTKV